MQAMVARARLLMAAKLRLDWLRVEKTRQGAPRLVIRRVTKI